MAELHKYKVDPRSTYTIYELGIADDFSYMQKPEGMDRDWLFNCLLAAWLGSPWEGDIRGSSCAGVFYAGLIPNDGYVEAFQDPVLVFKQHNNGETWAVTNSAANIAEPGMKKWRMQNPEQADINAVLNCQRIAEELHNGRYNWDYLDGVTLYDEAAKMSMLDLKKFAGIWGISDDDLSKMKGPRGKRNLLEELYSLGAIDKYPEKD